MKKSEIIILLMLVSYSFALPDLFIESVEFDHHSAMKMDVMQVTVRNAGNSPSPEARVSLLWDCATKTYSIRSIPPGEYATFVDVIYFPDAKEYTMNFVVDPDDSVLEMDENNNLYVKQFIVDLPAYSVEENEELDYEEEKTAPSCQDTDLMKIGRIKDENGNYVMENGQLSRDMSKDETIWLPPQEGNACGSTSLAYVMRYLTGHPYVQGDIDEHIRMTWGDGTYSDPFMMAQFAKDHGVNAEVYIDGSMEQLEWFIDHNIPVLVDITVDGSGDVMKGHWVVAVAHCLRPKPDGNGMERVMVFYNPWGYQHEISYSRFLKYWGRMDLGGIPLWNRLYIAFYVGSKPAGMPEGNVDSFTNLKLNTAASISQFLVAFQTMGDGFADLFSNGDFSAIWDIFVGFVETIFYAVVSIVEFLISLVVQIFSWIVDALEIAWCWFIGLFGFDCEGTPHFYKKTFFSSDSCGESAVYPNGLVLEKALGYMSETSGPEKVPIYVYLKTNKNGNIQHYIISSDSSYDEKEDNVVFAEFLGYTSKAYVPYSIELSKLIDTSTVVIKGNLGYLPRYKTDDYSKLVWLVKDLNTANKAEFLTAKLCANSRTFPVVLTTKGDPVVKPYTRDQILGYVYINEDDNVIPLYRFYDNKNRAFFVTNSLMEGINKSYSFSAVIGYLHNKTLAPTVSAMIKTCPKNETTLYRYYDKKNKIYILSTSHLQNSNYEDETFLGCIRTCPTECTMPLWVYVNQEIKKE